MAKECEEEMALKEDWSQRKMLLYRPSIVYEFSLYLMQNTANNTVIYTIKSSRGNWCFPLKWLEGTNKYWKS